MTADFSTETLKARGHGMMCFKSWKKMPPNLDKWTQQSYPSYVKKK
jgi:hypothetical protein